MLMTKRAYIHKDTGEIKEFKRGTKPVGDEWVYLPPMQRFINDEGKFVLRVQLEDSTVDIIETDENEVIEGEVVENGNTNAK